MMRVTLCLGAALLDLVAVLADAKVVPLTINKGTPQESNLQSSILKRARYLEQAVTNNWTLPLIVETGYFVDVEIGTPSQKLSLWIDTAGSDTWVVDDDTHSCHATGRSESITRMCAATFAPNISSSYSKIPGEVFNVSYTFYYAGEDLVGDYFQDNLSIGGTTVTSLRMGITKDLIQYGSTLGLGIPGSKGPDESRVTFLDELVSQNIIEKRAYSLYLNDLRATTGTILLGGIDTEKYVGNLVTVPIIRRVDNTRWNTITGNYTQIAVSLASVGLTLEDGTSSTIPTNVTTYVATDSVFSYLPSGITYDISRLFDAVYTGSGDSDGIFYIDCKYAQYDNVTVDFQFGDASSPKIKLPMSQLVLHAAQENLGYDSSNLPELPFKDVCILGINYLEGTNVLGQPFARSAYLVVDLDEMEVSIAQSKPNATGSNIVEISKGLVLSTITPTSTQAADPGTSSSASAAIRTLPPLNGQALIVAAISGAWMAIGSVWFFA